MYRKLFYLISFVVVLNFALMGTAKAELVGWWKLDEGSGTAANDSSGFGRHGTITEPIWEAGHFGSALKFEGSSYVDIPAEAWSTIETQATIMFWAYGDPDAQPQANFIFGAFQDPPNNESRVMSAHVPWSNGQVYFDTGGTTAGGYDRINQAATPDEFAGSWQHWAMVKNADTGDQMIYLNGVLWLSGSGLTRPMTGVTKFTIGTKPSLAEGWYYGMIDDVRLYDHALSEEEILAAMEGAGTGYPYALGPVPKDGAYHPDTWANLSWQEGDGAASHDVYIGDNFDAVNEGAGDTFRGNQTDTFFVVGFPGFPYPDGLVPGTTYYWRIDEIEADGTTKHTGDVWSFTIPPRTAYLPEPADGTGSVDVDVQLSWTAGWGAKIHTVYFGDNFYNVSNASGGLPQGTATYSPGPLELAKTYYWRVDEFDAITTHKGNVWSFTTEGAVSNPKPANGAVDATQTPILTWEPGVFGVSYEVYFGTDKNAVRNANTSSPEYKGNVNLDSEIYDPGQLERHTTYYWRIDQVNNASVDSPWKGPLWNFTTAEFLVIDDFENYNNFDEGEQWSNRIYNAWIDGYLDPMNGSQAGHLDPPFAEQTIVHGGLQSMPLFYNNTNDVRYSEAQLIFDGPQDWTEGGVDVLSLYVRGNSLNTVGGPLYIRIEDKVLYDPNLERLNTNRWDEFMLPLIEFANMGVNLAAVSEMSIGIGFHPAGLTHFPSIELLQTDQDCLYCSYNGVVYIDDVKLKQIGEAWASLPFYKRCLLTGCVFEGTGAKPGATVELASKKPDGDCATEEGMCTTTCNAGRYLMNPVIAGYNVTVRFGGNTSFYFLNKGELRPGLNEINFMLSP